MVSLERKRLDGRTSPVFSTSGGGCLIAFGLPFFLVGAGLLLAGYLRVSDGNEEATTLALMGGAFGAAGVFLFVTGIRSVLVARRRKREKARHPDEPWFWDFAWDPRGARHSAARSTTKSLLGLLFLTVFLLPFNWIVWSERIWPGILFVGLFDLITLSGWAMFVYQTLQGLKFGDSGLAFHHFPFFTGESLDVALLDTDRLRGLTTLSVTLRCLELVTEGSGKNARQVMYGIYEDVRQFGPEELYFGTGGGAGLLKLARKSDPLARLELSLPLPSGEVATEIGEGSATRFWQLEAKADLPGIDYAVEFLLPVYARPGMARRAGSLDA